MATKGKKIDKIIYSYAAMGSNSLDEENRILRDTVNALRKELELFREPPLMICEVKEMMEPGKAVIRIPNGNEFLVNISNQCGDLKAGEMVLVEQKNLTVIRKIPTSRHFAVERFVIVERPTTSWKEIGGLDEQMNEIKEVVELPLKKPELFKKVGITPPKGILLHGPPGTGKTLLAKAVAASTNSTFIEVVASELVQKFIGEGAKLVKEIFQLAKKKAPAIIFIDELDALASKRMEVGTSGEREVNRTFMQLLAEIDGFKSLGNVKVIGATNRKDILDPAVIRPGRLDRLIYVPIPNEKGRIEIFKIHSKDMKFEKFSLKRIIDEMDGFSGAEVKAVCTEAGYFAIRDNRIVVNKEDLLKAVAKVKQEEEQEKEYKHMFG